MCVLFSGPRHRYRFYTYYIGQVYWIGNKDYSSKWKCWKDRMWQTGDNQKTYGGVSYGDGTFNCTLSVFEFGAVRRPVELLLTSSL